MLVLNYRMNYSCNYHSTQCRIQNSQTTELYAFNFKEISKHYMIVGIFHNCKHNCKSFSKKKKVILYQGSGIIFLFLLFVTVRIKRPGFLQPQTQVSIDSSIFYFTGLLIIHIQLWHFPLQQPNQIQILTLTQKLHVK